MVHDETTSSEERRRHPAFPPRFEVCSPQFSVTRASAWPLLFLTLASEVLAISRLHPCQRGLRAIACPQRDRRQILVQHCSCPSEVPSGKATNRSREA